MSILEYFIIDDSDSSIIYEEGKWIEDTSILDYTVSGRPFNNTAHITFQQANFTITLEGDFIQFWGISSNSDVWIATINGQSLLSATDGNIVPPGAQKRFGYSAAYNMMKWGGSAQTVTMTVTGTKENPVAFDTLRIVRVSPGSEIPTGGEVMEYYLADGNGNNLTAIPPGWDISRFMSTTTPNAPYTFDFTGTSVAGLGGNSVNDSHIQAMASYSIDGSDPVMFTVNNLATSVLDDISRQTIFQTKFVTPGNHTIQIVYHGDSTTTPLTLVSLLVTGTERLLSVDPPPPAKSSTLAKAKTIAIAVPSIVIALLCLFRFFLCWKRKRRAEPKRNDLDPGPVAMAIDPFIDCASDVAEKNTIDCRNKSQAQAGRVQTQQDTYSSPVSPVQAGRVQTQQDTYSLPVSPAHIRVVTRMHEDSGTLPLQPVEQVVVVDVPPSYTSLDRQAQREDRRGEVAHLLKPCPSYES